jgi:hypothetical protein
MSKTRTFEIELNVPDDFDDRYNPSHLLCPGCMIINGMLAWTVYADPVTPAPQWRKATASDEGKQARFRNTEACKWQHGKLLHWGSGPLVNLSYLGLTTAKNGSIFPEWFRECEVPKE